MSGGGGPWEYSENWPATSDTAKAVPSGENLPSITWMTGGAHEPLARGMVSELENLQNKKHQQMCTQVRQVGWYPSCPDLTAGSRDVGHSMAW